MSESWERICITYGKWGDRESNPVIRDVIAESIGVEGFENSGCREAITDPVNLWIGEAASFLYGIFDDSLAFWWTVLLVILSRGVPKQHFEQNSRKKEKQSKQERR